MKYITYQYYSKLQLNYKIQYVSSTKFEDDSAVLDMFFNFESFDKKLWDGLSSNFHIKWNDETLKKYSTFLNWDLVSQNIATKWTFIKIYSFRECLNWKFLSSNPSVEWVYLLIELFKAEIIQSDEFFRNSKELWNEVGIERYKDWLNFSSKGLMEIIGVKKFKFEKINQFADYLDWDNLSESKMFLNSLENLITYKNYINWELACRFVDWDEGTIIRLLDINEVKNYISENASMTNKFVECNIDKFNVELLCNNSNVKFDDELFNKISHLNLVYIGLKIDQSTRHFEIYTNGGLLSLNCSINWVKVLTDEVVNQILQQIEKFNFDYRELIKSSKESVLSKTYFREPWFGNQLRIKFPSLFIRKKFHDIIEIDKNYYIASYVDSKSFVEISTENKMAKELLSMLKKAKTNYKPSKLQWFGFHTILNFGTYNDKQYKVLQILGDASRNYLTWCLVNVDFFVLDPLVIYDIIKLNGNDNDAYKELIKINRQKLNSYNLYSYEFNNIKDDQRYLSNNDDSYCDACGESPCLCSDREKTSSTFDF